jgi:hypothetical protein
MSVLIIAAALSLAALDSAPATATAPQTVITAPAAPNGSAPTAPAADETHKVCKATEITGSRFQRKMCLTRAEWVALEKREQEAKDDWVRRTDEHSGYAPTAGTMIGANGATGGQVR